ncbi:MAG: 50S ribosomal protein L37ae [Candidatus Micrarchaeota archaeon]
MGSHYGVKIRKRENEVLKQQRKLYPCPKCGKKSVNREGFGRWCCRSCNTQFAGGAYSLETSVGVTTRKTLASIKGKA